MDIAWFISLMYDSNLIDGYVRKGLLWFKYSCKVTLFGVFNACRSTQLNEAFSSPSKNQAMSPLLKFPLNTVSNGFVQCNNSLAS